MKDASQWLAGSDFVHNQDSWPSGGTIHSGLDPPKSIMNQENACSCLQDNLKEAFSLLRFPFLKQLWPPTGLGEDALLRQFLFHLFL